MNTLKKQIPNLLTLGNMLCGTIAIIYVIKGDFVITALLVVMGIVFDFFDGFVARLLKVQGELGKQLDSLADMVTSGVVPGLVMMQLLKDAFTPAVVGFFGTEPIETPESFFPYVGLLLTLFAGYRLAKFNIDERQTDSFIGLPTPAMSLFVISLPLITKFATQGFFVAMVYNKFFLIVTTFLLSFVMVSELPLFSLKFKNYALKGNAIKYLFLVFSILLLATLQFVAIPLIILLYVLLSVFNNFNTSKA